MFKLQSKILDLSFKNMGKYIFNSLVKYLHFESNKGCQIQFMHKTNI